MLRLHDLILERRDEVLDLVQRETGKVRGHAMEEVLDVAITARYYARSTRHLLRPKARRGALPVLTHVRELRQPKGVVGIIAPWNYPLSMAITDAIPALMAGNTVVLKPDSQTVLTALWAADLMRAAGLPEGVLQMVVGPGSVVGTAMIERADFMMFTGSTRTGREVAARCAERLIGCSLELGGKNALIVLEDADLDRAADIVLRGAFASAGQLCVSIERLLVHESVKEQFLARFIPKVLALRLSAAVGWGGDMGSLASEKQLESVRSHVDDAVAKGATVLAGGRPRPDIGPLVYEPTVLDDVTPDMVVCEQETFGPVVSVYTFRDDDEAVRRANATTYGLNASVVTRDVARGRTIAARLRAGTVNINEGYAAAWGSVAAPMGGMGHSGLGRRHGDEGLLKYTEAQTIATQRIVGFGPQFGLSDERWAELLTRSIGLMKTLGLR